MSVNASLEGLLVSKQNTQGPLGLELNIPLLISTADKKLPEFSEQSEDKCTRCHFDEREPNHAVSLNFDQILEDVLDMEQEYRVERVLSPKNVADSEEAILEIEEDLQLEELMMIQFKGSDNLKRLSTSDQKVIKDRLRKIHGRNQEDVDETVKPSEV